MSAASYKVLLVEDVKSIRMLGQRMLSQSGAQCATAVDGAVAVAAVLSAAAKGKPFDCVLMDFHMPVVDGMEATRTILSAPTLRARSGSATADAVAAVAGTPPLPPPPAPVIFGFTADVMDDTVAAFKAAGAVLVLTKPYKLPTIVSAVLQYCPRPLGTIATASAASSGEGEQWAFREHEVG